MRKKVRMTKAELEREWTWTLVEIALLLLAMVFITAGYRVWGGVAAGVFTLILLRPGRATSGGKYD